MKKILAYIISAALLLSSIPMVSAAELDKTYDVLVNSSMDENLDGWTNYTNANGSIAWTKDGAYGTAGCCKVTGVGRTSSTNYGLCQEIILKKGETYRVSFTIKMASGTGRFGVILADNAGTLYLPNSSTRFDVGTTWKKVEFEFEFEALTSKNTEATGKGKLFLTNKNNNDYYIDEFSIKGLGKRKIDYVDPLPEAKTSAQSKFNDISGHWAESTINVMNSVGVTNGVSETEFCPENTVTRAEFIALLMRSLKLKTNQYTDIYKDVKADDWFANELQTAYDLDLIPAEMTVDGNFKHNSALLREEAGAILGRIGELKNLASKNAVTAFSDKAKISSWAQESILSAYRYGLMSGFPDGSFQPKGTLTRAQAAEIVKSIYELDNRIAFYVDPDNGDDNNEGTLASPYKTIDKAKNMVRQYNDDMKSNLYVFLKPTEHFISKALEFDTEDSGSNGYDIVYASYGSNDKAVLSGGIHVNGWSLHDPEKNIYVANVGRGVESRQLYVNGIRATRSRTKRPLGADKIYPNALSNCEFTDDGITTTDTFLADYSRVSDLELAISRMWSQWYAGVSSIKVEDGLAHLTMDQPIWDNIKATMATDVQYMHLENAYELLDEQGEWYLNSSEGKLFYKPRYFEDMNTADVVLPINERLITMEGVVDDSVNDMIHNIRFENIAFNYTTWMRPSSNNGHHTAQNNWLRDHEKTVETGYDILGLSGGSTIHVNNGRYIDFVKCEFSKLGFAALTMIGSVQDCDIIGNNFYDISGNAIEIGQPLRYVPKLNNPDDPRYFIVDNEISNNYFHAIGRDEHSSSAIGVTYPKDTVIRNNEITDTSYAGVHVGGLGGPTRNTGIDNFVIENNYFHDFMNYNFYDAGAIYTCSGNGATSFDEYTLIQNNYVKNYWGWPSVFYNDTGTVGTKYTNNVVDQSEANPFNYKFSTSPVATYWFYGTVVDYWQQAENNYSTFDAMKGPEKTYILGSEKHKFEEPHLYPDANWPAEAQQIVDEAGLEPEYLAMYPDEPQVVKVTADRNIRTESRGFTTVAITGETYDSNDKKEIKVGDSFKLNVDVRTRKDKPITPSNIYYISHDEDIATVDSNGVVTAVAPGVTAVDVLVKSGDVLLRNEVEFVVDDHFESIEFNIDSNVSMVEGSSQTLTGKLSAMSKRTINGFDMKLSSDNENVLSVNDDGLFKAISPGKAKVTAEITVDGDTHSFDFNVSVCDSDYSKYVYDLGADLKSIKNWVTYGGKYDITESDDGVNLKTSSKNVYLYTPKQFTDAVFKFDYQSNLSGSAGGRYIVLRNPSKIDLYNSSPYNYVVLISDKSVSLLRFINGKSVNIYHTSAGKESLAGPPVPFDFETNKRYSIELGTINVEGGVRILMKIDGKTIFDYIDTTEERIEEGGYFSMKAPDFALFPTVE